MKPNRLSWTPEENERLKAMVAQGATVVRAAGAFNRSMIAVRTQARRLGAPFSAYRTVRKKWADISPDAARQR